MHEGHDEEYDDMRATGGFEGVFETEFVNGFDGWSISFQTVHDEPEEKRVNQRLILAGQRYIVRGAHSFWYSVINLKSRGVEGIRRKAKLPTRTESNPSYMNVIQDCNKWQSIEKYTRMKIQAHPGFPPMPSMFSIAAASNPERVPESWVELQRPKHLTEHFITHRA